MADIRIELDALMKERGISLKELSEKVGITNINLSRLRNGKVRAIRFSTLKKLCEVLKCEPGDILKYGHDD